MQPQSNQASNSLENRSRPARRGFATLLVLLVVAALSLAVYTFANQSFLEHSATRSMLRQTQSRLAAASAIEAMRSQLLMVNPQQRHLLLNSNPNKVLPAFDSQQPELQMGIYRRASRGSLAAGLISESAKLNINALDLSRGAAIESRARLTAFVNLTPQMADSLLDWIDKDDEPRAFGAEADWYAENSPKIRPANGPVRHVSELVSIRGFNERLVFGEDTNHNGWLDWNEDDGDLQLPSDDRDGTLDVGLSEYLSLNAFETNLDVNGRRKIYLNQSDLSELFLQMEERFGERAAAFVAAYRLDGPVSNGDAGTQKDLRQELDRTFDSRIEKQLDESGELPENRAPSRRSVKRKGVVSLDRTPLYRIESILDLVGVSVVAIIDGEEKLLESPWVLNGAESHELLLKLESTLTTVEGDRLLGRIDINQAPLEVLLTIPGLTRSKAEAIVAMRARSEGGSANASYRSVYWLVEKQILSLEELRQIATYITVGGAIYSGYAAGHDRTSHSSAFIKFTLCQEGSAVRILEQSEIGFAPLIEQDVRHDRSKIR